MKKNGLDNFAEWRSKQYISQLLEKNGDLAELIGMVLGDGSIHTYDRTEGLRIVLPLKKPGMVSRYADLVERVFGKKPSVIKRNHSACVDIRLYQKGISTRLEIPTGARKNLIHTVPNWIFQNREFVIRYLRGLYEAEGCHSVHEATYTHKLFFSNVNQSLLDIVRSLMTGLGFHPHVTSRDVQISRKVQVYEAMRLLRFGEYEEQ